MSDRTRRDSKRDKYMNWCIAIVDAECRICMEYMLLHDMELGSQTLLPIPMGKLKIGEITTRNMDDNRPALMILGEPIEIEVITVSIWQYFSDNDIINYYYDNNIVQILL